MSGTETIGVSFTFATTTDAKLVGQHLGEFGKKTVMLPGNLDC